MCGTALIVVGVVSSMARSPRPRFAHRIGRATLRDGEGLAERAEVDRGARSCKVREEGRMNSGKIDWIPSKLGPKKSVLLTVEAVVGRKVAAFGAVAHFAKTSHQTQ
jgi:hypothetical protein